MPKTATVLILRFRLVFKRQVQGIGRIKTNKSLPALMEAAT